MHCSAENIKAVRLAALCLLKLLISLTNVGNKILMVGGRFLFKRQNLLDGHV